MKYHQRDIVEIDFPIPGEGYKIHPAVIVSNDELQVDEGFAYVALISSQDFAYSRQSGCAYISACLIAFWLLSVRS